MKNINLYLFLLTLFLNSVQKMNSQTVSNVNTENKLTCNTPASCPKINSALINLDNTNFRIPNKKISVCVRIYVHVIRNSEGYQGQSNQNVFDAIYNLRNSFSNSNIYFDWGEDQIIDYIDNNQYHINALTGFNYPTSNASIFSVNRHTDGIDIYFFSDEFSSFNGGLASGIGTDAALLVSGRYPFPPYYSLTTSQVLSHEMGHVLGLWHTHHGTANEGLSNDPNYDFLQCPELVNGSNSSTCGDYVTDTPADPRINFNVDSSCVWLGNGFDANNEAYNPSTNNIMSYSNPICNDIFTPKQAIRMKSALQNLPNLQLLSSITYGAIDLSKECKVTATALTLYPNPADNELFLKNENNTGFNYTIFDTNLNIVSFGKTENNLESINTSYLINGTYYINISTSKEVVLKTIIINHKN